MATERLKCCLKAFILSTQVNECCPCAPGFLLLYVFFGSYGNLKFLESYNGENEKLDLISVSLQVF